MLSKRDCGALAWTLSTYMEVAVSRCWSPHSSPISGQFHRKPPNVAGESQLYGRWTLLRFKVEKHTTPMGDGRGETRGAHPVTAAFRSSPPKFSVHYEVDQAAPYDDITKEAIPKNGRVSMLPAVAPLISATSLLIIPLEALAETCEVDNSMSNMPIILAVALIGATVGGLLARQRRGELQKVNEQLRQINAALRRQAKIESYAPRLSYAPVTGRLPEKDIIVDPKKQELISHLKSGKNFLRNQDPEKASAEFEIALELAQNVGDPLQKKKAVRGLGASLQRQGKYHEAIKYHSMVLQISKQEGEDSGNTEAYGAIADCYTELGDLEKAGKYYDDYIARLNQD